VEGFYLELIGKLLSYQDAKVETIIKTRHASHGLIMTRPKVIGKIMFTRRRGERKNSHF
jgi:hypothetical protein